MNNRIMERIDLYRHAAACHAISVNQFGKDSEQSKFRADIHAKAGTLLNVEIQAQQDYTRAVIAERDALNAELEVAHIAIKQLVEVRDKTQQEANQLRKAAQMALDTLQYLYSDMTDHENDIVNDSIKALLKELGHG